jgi:hypothetical protein
VPHRQSIEDLTVGLPLGHELIHQFHEMCDWAWRIRISNLPRISSSFAQLTHAVRDLPLLKTPEGTILVSQRSGIRGMSV